MKNPLEDIEEEPDDSFFDGDSELMDQELTEEDGTVNTDVKPQFSAIANVSCQYDGTPGKDHGFIYFFSYHASYIVRVGQPSHPEVGRGAPQSGRVYNPRTDLPDGQ